jgi:uncharacterized glyoxalase superfamily protein PhnB
MPSSAVIPQLPYSSVTEAAAWLERVFGFGVRLSIGDHRVQMNAAGGHVVLIQAGGTPMRGSVLVRVEDVDAHHAQAVAGGAQVGGPPQTFPYGERQYTVIDCGGHAWTFSQSIDDVAPESWGGASGRL